MENDIETESALKNLGYKKEKDRERHKTNSFRYSQKEERIKTALKILAKNA